MEDAWHGKNQVNASDISKNWLDFNSCRMIRMNISFHETVSPAQFQ